MDRPALRTGGSLALGVLVLGAVHSGLTLAMAGGDGPAHGLRRCPIPPAAA